MANPAPPAASYTNMHTRVGFADGAVLTQSQLDQVAGYLVAQDGSGNVQRITSLSIGPRGWLSVAVNNYIWLARNAYYASGDWYPFDSSSPSFALVLETNLVLIQYAPAVGGDGPVVWQRLTTWDSSGDADLNGEVARAQAAESALSVAMTAAVSAEVSRAEAAEAALSALITSDVNAEEARALAVEAGLQAQINNIGPLFGHFAAGGSVDAATTAALPTCTYVNEVAGVGAFLIAASVTALASQDGVAMTVGKRLLVKDQANAIQNGVYTLTQQGNGTTLPWILTRATDADSERELASIIVNVAAGTANGHKLYVLPLSVLTVGTTLLAFSEWGGSGSGGGGGSGIGSSVDVVSGPVTLVAGRNGLANCTGATLNCILPNSAIDGTIISVFDDAEFSTNPSVDGASVFNFVIASSSQTFTVNIDGGGYSFMYIEDRGLWLPN